jgi:CheY-like chemotaxis protein
MRHVLVVDDDPAICAVMQMGLEVDGSYRVSSAESAEATLDILDRDPPDAAIIDAVLPRVMGLVLARTVVDRGIPVLLTTGEPLFQQRMSEAGCRFLAKPFSLAQLVAETQRLIDEARERVAESARCLARLAEAGGELRQVLEQSQRLIEAGRRRRGAPPFEALAAPAEDILLEALAITGADKGNLQLADGAANALRIVASRGLDARFLKSFALVRRGGDSVYAAAFKLGARVVVPDLLKSACFANTPSGRALREAGIRAVQSTPFFGRGGGLLGLISTHWTRPWSPEEGQLQRLDALARRAAQEMEGR